MSKTLSAEAEHKPYFTTKRMALIGVMTAVTCININISIIFRQLLCHCALSSPSWSINRYINRHFVSPFSYRYNS